MGFLVDDDFDELAALEELRIKGMSDPVQNVTLLTTTECNITVLKMELNNIQ